MTIFVIACGKIFTWTRVFWKIEVVDEITPGRLLLIGIHGTPSIFICLFLFRVAIFGG